MRRSGHKLPDKRSEHLCRASKERPTAMLSRAFSKANAIAIRSSLGKRLLLCGCMLVWSKEEERLSSFAAIQCSLCCSTAASPPSRRSHASPSIFSR